MFMALPASSSHMAVRVCVMPSVNCLKPLNSMTKGSEASSTR